jgi:hypothetical protein
MSPIDQRYYASWALGLAALGGVLLVASSEGALEVLLAAAEALATWSFTLGLVLFPV